VKSRGTTVVNKGKKKYEEKLKRKNKTNPFLHHKKISHTKNKFSYMLLFYIN